MKVSATRHDRLSFRSHCEQPLGFTCRQNFSLGSSMEALESQKDKLHLYWPRLGPDFSIGTFPPDDRLVLDRCQSSEDLLQSSPADIEYNKLQLPQLQVLHGDTMPNSEPSLDGNTDHAGLLVTNCCSSTGEPTVQPQSNIRTSECHCERLMVEEASDAPASPRVKLLCSFGGRIMTRPVDGKLRYVGGETRIVTVSRHVSFADFMSKMAQFYGASLGLKYQLPDEDLDALVSVSSDDDLQNMMEEYDKVESGRSTASWLRLFFFSSPIEVEVSEHAGEGEDRFSLADNQKYVDAINGVTEKLQGSLLEEAVPGFRQVGASNAFDQVNEVNETLSKGPSAPSSSPSSPSLASGNVSYHKPSTLPDVSLPNLNEHLSKVQVFEEDCNKEGSGSSSSTPYHHQIEYQHHDEQIFLAADSPRIVHYDLPVSRAENWAGLRYVDSQAKVLRQPEPHVAHMTNGGVSLEHWHDMQPSAHDGQVSAHDMFLPLGEHQRLLQQHKHSLFQQQQHQQHQLPGQQQNWHLPVDGESIRMMHHDIHNKQPQVALQPPHQHFSHHHVAAHDTWRNEHHVATIPFVHGSNPINPQIRHGLAPAPPYQMGSAPPLPRVAIYDHQGKCSCGLQHSQIHRGITVSIGDLSYSRGQPQSGDQACKKNNFRNSFRFNDNTSHDMAVWQQGGDVTTVADTEHREYGVTPWQHYQAMHSRECQLDARSRGLLYSDPVLHHGEYLSTHDRHDMNKRCNCMRCADARRQLSETSAFSEAPDLATEWIMHRKGFDLDGGRVLTPRKAFPRTPLYKEEERLGDFTDENSPETEFGLATPYIPGDFDARTASASRVAALPYSRKPPIPAVSQIIKPSPLEELVSQPSGHTASDWQSRVALDSWSMTSLEPGLCADTPPLQHGQTANRFGDVCRISLDREVSNVNLVMGSVAMVEQPINTEVQGDHFNELRYHPLRREDNGMPAVVVGRVAGEVAMSGVQFLEGGLNNGVKAPIAHGDTYVPSPDVIPSAPSASSASLHFQQAIPGANLVTGIMDQKFNVPASPIYDQSPLISTKASNFSFAPGDLPPKTKNDRVPATYLPVSELLTGGMTSSVLEHSSIEESIHENTDAVLKVAACTDSIKVLLEQSIAGIDTDKNPASQGTDKNPASLGPNLSILSVGEQGKSLLEIDANLVNDLVGGDDGKVDMTQIMQSGATNKTFCQEKDSEICNANIEESKEPVLLQAEAEARARGLQIIKNADLEDLKELGSGTYGTVYHGKWRGSDVAIKRIKASCFNGSPSERDRLIADFWKEACTLGQLHHPNVVAFYGVVPDGPGGTLATVTEYMVNGSLKQVLQKKDRTIDRRKRLFIAMDAAFGMEYLHSKNVVHFDLKCENLLVNMRDAHRPICKVGDFGLSKVKHQTLVSGGVRGTLPWMAPELLNGSSRMVTEKVDVFSFGIVMWELLTGEEPYANMHCGAIINGIVNNTLRPTIPTWCDPGWRNLMEKCWSVNPSDRPAFAEVASELRAIAASMNLK